MREEAVRRTDPPEDKTANHSTNGARQNIGKVPKLNGRSLVFSHYVLPNDVDQFRHMSFANYVKLMFDAADYFFVKMLGANFQEKLRVKLKYASVHFKKQTQTGDLIYIVPQCKISGHRVIVETRYLVENLGIEDDVASGEMIYEIQDFEGRPKNFSDSLGESAHEASFDESVELIGDIPEKNIFQKQTAKNIYYYDKIKVYFKHTDFYGGLHEYNYFEWTSHVREAFLSDKCTDLGAVLKSSVAMMTSKIELEVLGESEFSDQIVAHLTAAKVKKVSCELIINFLNQRLNKYVATTRHTLVFADQKALKFSVIPESLRPAMIAYSEL